MLALICVVFFVVLFLKVFLQLMTEHEV